MTTFTASIHVRPDVENELRPTMQRVEDAANTLRDQGFEVLYLGRFVVSVRAPSFLFLEKLGVQLEVDQPIDVEVNPSSADLALLVDRLVIAPLPILF